MVSVPGLEDENRGPGAEDGDMMESGQAGKFVFMQKDTGTQK